MQIQISRIYCVSFFCFCFPSQQKWEQKAVEAKDKYTKQMKEFEANGGGKEVGKKRGGAKATRKAPAKKGKKKADSDDDDEEEDESE